MYRYLLIFFLANANQGFAQAENFPVDESGKYILTDVVELKGMTKDQLFENGEKFMKKIKVLHSRSKYINSNKENYQLKNRGSFYVYRLGSLKKGIAGAVEYDITLDFKDEKYRYQITNFRFNEYKKNRYGKYEPIKGKYTPLEMEASSLNMKEWNNQKEVVYQKSQELIQNLNGEMIYAEEKKGKNPKKKKDW